MRKLSFISVGLLLATFLSFSAFAADFSIRGAESEINIAPNDATMSYEADPGDVIQGTIKLRNKDSEVLNLALNVVDATYNEYGSFTLKSFDADQLGVGAWLELESDEVFIEPESTVEVPFTINIPENATPGQLAGGILAAAIAPEMSGPGFSITTEIGMRVYVAVSGEITTDIAWSDYSVSGQDKENITVGYVFENGGNTLINLNGVIESSTWFGEDQSVEVDLGLSQSGATLEPQVELTKPFFGPMKITSVVSYAVNDFSGGEMEYQELDNRTITAWAIPWLYVGIVGGVLLLIIIPIVLSRVQRKKMLKTFVPYKAKKGDTLPELAAKYGIDWKKLAKLNKVSAPYILVSGQEMLVPPKKK